jgi:hypothetical protein
MTCPSFKAKSLEGTTPLQALMRPEMHANRYPSLSIAINHQRLQSLTDHKTLSEL